MILPNELKQHEVSVSLVISTGKQEKLNSLSFKSDTSIYLVLPLRTSVQFRVFGEFIKTQHLYLHTDSLPASNTIAVKLQKNTIHLDAVTIKGSTIFTESKDTLRVSTANILTRPHADAGELLNNISGINVGANGQMTAMGKRVGKVTVDGKELFGGNSKATIEAIKSDMVQQVQIINSDLGNDQNEINLVLKEDKKDGKYGTISASLGTNHRYHTGLKINAIKPSSFFNFFVNGNNTNEKAISDIDYLSMVNFNMENASSGSQKIYYNHKLENSFENLERLLKRGDFDIGTVNTISTGLGYHKTTDRLKWNSFVLSERPDALLNRTRNNTSLISPYRINTVGNETSSSLDYHTVAESSLKWKLDEHNTVNGKVTFNHTAQSSIDQQQSSVALYDGYDHKLSEDKLLFDREYDKRGVLLHVKGAWEHRFEKPANKLTLIAGLLHRSHQANNLYLNMISSTTINGNDNQVDQRLNDRLFYSSVSQSILLLPKLLLDLNFSAVLEDMYLRTNGFNKNPVTGTYDSLSPSISAGDIHVPKKTLTGQAFLYYKASRFSAVASSGILWNNWELRQHQTLKNSQRQYVFLPNFNTSYSFNDRKSSLSLTHTTSLTDPLMEQVNPVYDSTYVQRVTLGNPSLVPFVQKNFSLNGSSLVKGLGSLNAQLSYTKSRMPVINSNFIQDGLPLNGYAQMGEAAQGSAIISLFRFQAERKVNTSLMLIYLWKRQDQEVNTLLRRMTLNTFMVNAGMKWKIGPTHKLNLDAAMSFNQVDIADLAGSNTNARLLWRMSNEHRLPFDFYGQFSTKWLILDDGDQTHFFRPVVNFQLSKYLLTQNSLMLKLGISNLLDITSIQTIRSTPDQINQTADIHLPRYFHFGISFYPEIWKKKSR